MKVAICTIVDYNNYGNRLQNLALQHILAKKGYDVVTLKNIDHMNKSILDKFKKILSLRAVKQKLNSRLINIKYKKHDALRFEKFKNFTDKYIIESSKIYNDMTAEELNDFDFFVIGSDQVWNYNYQRSIEFNFAMFTNKPKFSYAASFGVSDIPQDIAKKYSEGLNELDVISVREEAGKLITEKLTSKRATVVLDPTLLLEKKEWIQILGDREKYTAPYILTYFLDEPLHESMNYINKIAKETGLEIKKLSTRKDLELWTKDPADFINLFSQAEYIFTDSFHACVFAIIFEKNFEVFERNTKSQSMNSRIETLFSILGLEDRWHGDKKKPIEYSIVNELLNQERKKSLDFLDKALKEIEKNKETGE